MKDAPAWRGENLSSGVRWGLFWLCSVCAALMAAISWESDERRWLALAIAVVLGAYLGVLAAARWTEGEALSRSRTLMERFQAAPDWVVRLAALTGAAALLTVSFLPWGRQEIFAPAAVVGWSLIGLIWLARPRPFSFRRR